MSRRMYDIPKVIGDRILVEVEIDLDNEVGIKKSIIALPDSAKERRMLSTNVGRVLQIGANAADEALIEEDTNELLPGHIVKFLSNAGVVYQNETEETGNDRMFRIIRRGDIMAIVGEDLGE